jgi:hypothetical protein
MAHVSLGGNADVATRGDRVRPDRGGSATIDRRQFIVTAGSVAWTLPSYAIPTPPGSLPMLASNALARLF